MALINSGISVDYDFDKNTEIIDVDHEGIMEILMSMPSYEGFIFNKYKYSNGTFDGKYVNECSLKP